MKKFNCWEFMKCGRQPGGDKLNGRDVCPAAKDNPCNGLNDGEYGGRICWAIAGTFCKGEIQGTIASKIADCVFCGFYKKVKSEEDEKLVMYDEIIDRIYS